MSDVTAAAALPALTAAEWGYVLDANRGMSAWIDRIGESGVAMMLWVNVAENMHLCEKWRLTMHARKTLTVRLGVLDLATQLAVMELVDRFWAEPTRDPLLDTLQRIGAPVST